MKTRQLFAILVLAVTGLASATSQTWRIGDDQPFPIHISDLPATRQEAILRALEPSLQKRATEYDDEPADVDAIRKSLLLRELKAPSGTLLLVQGWGLDACGGTGNCALWILGPKNQVLLEGQAYRLTILRERHNGLPSIVTSSSWTGDGSVFIRYAFDGRNYLPGSCAIERTQSPDLKTVYKKPRLDYVSCKLVLPVSSIQSCQR